MAGFLCCEPCRGLFSFRAGLHSLQAHYASQPGPHQARQIFRNVGPLLKLPAQACYLHQPGGVRRPELARAAARQGQADRANASGTVLSPPCVRRRVVSTNLAMWDLCSPSEPDWVPCADPVCPGAPSSSACLEQRIGQGRCAMCAAASGTALARPCVRRRVIFTSLEKFDGQSRRALLPAEVKQIAGRAGRFGSRFCGGVVTALHKACPLVCSECLSSSSYDQGHACS